MQINVVLLMRSYIRDARKFEKYFENKTSTLKMFFEEILDDYGSQSIIFLKSEVQLFGELKHFVVFGEGISRQL